MPNEVPIPDHLLRDIRARVERGEYPDVPTAVAELLRLGLAVKKKRESDRPSGMPPRLPEGERPTSVDPSDVNWM